MEERTMIEAWENIKESFLELAEQFSEKMDAIRELFESTKNAADDYFEWKKLRELTRASWHVPADTRLKSQVIMNKPRNLVKKVIR